MPWKKTKNADYIGEWYNLMTSLQGKEIFSAYHDMFPTMPEDPKAHYELLNDKANRKLMVVLYRSRNLSIEQLAQRTGLDSDDITKRLDFFKANGMKKVKIRETA